MKWANLTSRLINSITRTDFEPVVILEHPESVTPETVKSIVRALGFKRFEKKALASLVAALLVRPEHGKHVPVSVLERQLKSDRFPGLWQKLALLLLHTDQRSAVAQWLNLQWIEQSEKDETLALLEHVSAWFPETLNRKQLQAIAESKNSAPYTALYQRQSFLEQVNPAAKTVGDFEKVLRPGFRLLIVHNIVDGLGDEIIRIGAIAQAFLDAHPDNEVVLFTDRLFLYDHPKLRAHSISDNRQFSEELEKPWNGIINFFEPYLPENSYNLEIQTRLKKRIVAHEPTILVHARKDVNHYVFESIKIENTEYAQLWDLQKRLLPLNYEASMRFITHLGLPLRTGETIPAAGSIYANNSDPPVQRAWQEIKAQFESQHKQKGRPIAIINAFGGQNALKGFQRTQYARLAQILCEIIEQGYDLAIVATRESWGARTEIDAILAALPEEFRKHAIPAPVPEADSAQQKMRRIISFVSLADHIVTVEGWMMHLSYSMGKKYDLLMAPHSQKAEWQPHGRSANQGHPLKTTQEEQCADFALPLKDGSTPPLLHYPAKDLFNAAIGIWKMTADRYFAQRLLYWLGSADFDVRKVVIAAVGSADAAFFQAEQLKALQDCNREVRAAAASSLLSSGRDLSNELGEDWKNVLEAYRLLGEFRFQELLPLAHAAYRPLRACLNNDESEVNRDARLMLEAMKMSKLEAHKKPPEDMVLPKILILTPIKNAAHDAETYFAGLRSLDYPGELLSIGILESDSTDDSFDTFQKLADENKSHFRIINIWQKSFGYAIPEGIPRWEPNIQFERRSTLARSRNHLLFHALDDEDYVLWLDSDVLEFPPDIIQRLLSYNKDIVQPHCVKKYGGPTFDLNAWRDHGRLFMHDLRTEGEIIPIDAVGGTMLLIKADCHRDGLVFPPFLYGKRNAKVRSREDISMPGQEGEVETEGLGILASDMNFQCWGLPHLEIIHADR